MTNKTVLTEGQIARIGVRVDVCYEPSKFRVEFARAIEQAVLQSSEIQRLRKDAERLDFMIENLAWAQSFERDGSILQYRLMTQNEDEDYVFMSGEDRYFNTPRDAIDAAMEVKP